MPTGFILQPTYQIRAGRPVVQLFGRLSGGGAFLVEEDRFRPYFFVPKDAAAALKRIAGKAATFASRGDDSGTHKRERTLWDTAGVDVKAASGAWYRELGSGMGATLNTAAGLGAYALTDRGTWISFANKGNLEILVEGDRRLFNPYGVIVVNPKKFPHVKAGLAGKFAA